MEYKYIPKNKRKLAFEYLVVFDLECAWNKPPAAKIQEIIEFPSVVLRLSDGAIVSEIDMFVKTKYIPVILPETTELTGITAEQVLGGLDFASAVNAYDEWLQSLSLPQGSFCIACCGDFDGKMIHQQAARENLMAILPAYFHEWINLKECFRFHYSLPKQLGMAGMLNHRELPLIGRHHSGIDDCRNLARLAHKMTQDGYTFSSPTASWPKKINSRLL